MAKFRVTAYDNSYPPKKISDKTYTVENVAKVKANSLKRNKRIKAIFINNEKVY